MNPYESIKNAIILGKYEPGSRLTEESLAKELSVSRTPIREALKSLESDGLIISLSRGMMVRQFSYEDIKQIYDLRSLLESYAAKLAANNRDKEDLEKMDSLVDEFSSLLENDLKEKSITKQIMNNNSDFHNAIIKASKNDYLNFHISKVVFLPLVFSSFYWYDRKDIERSFETHVRLIEAIRNRDSDRALVSMQDHIFTGRDFVLSSVESSKFYKQGES
ncbi:GntR family transcriptional regulator [Virgibacillus byunsanensis]|uniref:GntR family transcriptional regulator n=1 Tax=Virgibacillus byunsanensis TaxID=570945 RepID=A0ABW3LK31_9BACI